jgi:hypothetical protein
MKKENFMGEKKPFELKRLTTTYHVSEDVK